MLYVSLGTYPGYKRIWIRTASDPKKSLTSPTGRNDCECLCGLSGRDTSMASRTLSAVEG